MRIDGINELSSAELEAHLTAGGRFAVFEYCISLVVVTLHRRSGVYWLRPGEKGLFRGLPYTALSLLLGWWGVPWGFIYTPLVIVTNLSGGCDITAEVKKRMREE